MFSITQIKIEDGITNLKQFEHYLSIEPFPNYLLEKKICEKDYFKLQFENFFIRCSSIIDYNMHLINNTLQIGLPNYKCGYNSLKENKNIKGTRLLIKMSDFYRDFQDIIKTRNGIIHQGEFENELLDNINAFIVPELPIELFDEDFNSYSSDEKKKYTEIAVNRLNKLIEKLEFHFVEILKELNSVIDLQLSIFDLKAN